MLRRNWSRPGTPHDPVRKQIGLKCRDGCCRGQFVHERASAGGSDSCIEGQVTLLDPVYEFRHPLLDANLGPPSQHRIEFADVADVDSLVARPQATLPPSRVLCTHRARFYRPYR